MSNLCDKVGVWFVCFTFNARDMKYIFWLKCELKSRSEQPQKTEEGHEYFMIGNTESYRTGYQY